MTIKLFMKPFRLAGIKRHDNIPIYHFESSLQRSGSINGKEVTFICAPTPKKSCRVSFEWEGMWYFVDRNVDLYELVKNGQDKSMFLDFFIE